MDNPAVYRNTYASRLWNDAVMANDDQIYLIDARNRNFVISRHDEEWFKKNLLGGELGTNINLGLPFPQVFRFLNLIQNREIDQCEDFRAIIITPWNMALFLVVPFEPKEPYGWERNKLTCYPDAAATLRSVITAPNAVCVGWESGDTGQITSALTITDTSAISKETMDGIVRAYVTNGRRDDVRYSQMADRVIDWYGKGVTLIRPPEPLKSDFFVLNYSWDYLVTEFLYDRHNQMVYPK